MDARVNAGSRHTQDFFRFRLEIIRKNRERRAAPDCGHPNAIFFAYQQNAVYWQKLQFSGIFLRARSDRRGRERRWESRMAPGAVSKKNVHTVKLDSCRKYALLVSSGTFPVAHGVIHSDWKGATLGRVSTETGASVCQRVVVCRGLHSDHLLPRVPPGGNPAFACDFERDHRSAKTGNIAERRRHTQLQPAGPRFAFVPGRAVEAGQRLAAR